MADKPPIPLLEVFKNWCAFHNRDEPPEPGGGNYCGECRHYFAPGELVKEWNKLADQLDLRHVTTVEEIRSCPLCAHDF